MSINITLVVIKKIINFHEIVTIYTIDYVIMFNGILIIFLVCVGRSLYKRIGDGSMHLEKFMK
jgi:hypothetical protein